MANIQIRKYRDEDAERVQEIFISGMSEHLHAAFMHALKQPLTQLVFLCTFCALLTSSVSFLISFLAVTVLLLGARYMVRCLFNRYIETCVKKDLGNISKTYLMQKDSCFWVAESDGQVVGTVGCVPAENEPGCLRLKRMSVRHSHRRLGIAKDLCRTVAAFTRERGYTAVTLHTSVVQIEAQKLYEHMGYRKISESAAPELAGKLFNFNLIVYRFDLQKN